MIEKNTSLILGFFLSIVILLVILLCDGGDGTLSE